VPSLGLALSFELLLTLSSFLCLQNVTSDYDPLKRRVESVVQIAMAIVTPLSALAPGAAARGAGGGLRSLVDDLPKVKRREVEGFVDKGLESVREEDL